MIDLSREQFIERLVAAGWDEAEAAAEYDRIQSEPDESGVEGDGILLDLLLDRKPLFDGDVRLAFCCGVERLYLVTAEGEGAENLYGKDILDGPCLQDSGEVKGAPRKPGLYVGHMRIVAQPYGTGVGEPEEAELVIELTNVREVGV